MCYIEPCLFTITIYSQLFDLCWRTQWSREINVALNGNELKEKKRLLNRPKLYLSIFLASGPVMNFCSGKMAVAHWIHTMFFFNFRGSGQTTAMCASSHDIIPKPASGLLVCFVLFVCRPTLGIKPMKHNAECPAGIFWKKNKLANLNLHKRVSN